MRKQKKNAPSNRNVLVFLLWIICIIGVIDSVYLFYSHYRVHTDMGFRSFCAISKALNCDTVSQSPYAVFLNLPVPLWGILGYLFFAAFLWLATKKERKKPAIFLLLFMIALLFSIYSLVLAFLSTYVIHSYCLFCIVSYAVNLGLLICSWMVYRSLTTYEDAQQKEPLGAFFSRQYQFLGVSVALFFFIALSFWIWLPKYWSIESYAVSRDKNNIVTGVTEDGHPFMGGINPILIITEFSDYRCFQCRKMHFYIRQLIQKYPEKIRLIHRHFPLDHAYNPIVKRPFHIGSGMLSLISIYAATENKFWRTNDVIFSLPKDIKAINSLEIARDSALDPEKMRRFLKDKKAKEFLMKDINEGIALNIDATPGFIIDGKLYTGRIPPEVFKEKLGF